MGGSNALAAYRLNHKAELPWARGHNLRWAGTMVWKPTGSSTGQNSLGTVRWARAAGYESALDHSTVMTFLAPAPVSKATRLSQDNSSVIYLSK